MKKLLYIAITACLLAKPAGIHAYEKVAGQAGVLQTHVEKTDPRVEKLKSYLTDKNPEFAAISWHIVREADRLSLDWKLIPAIAGLESSFCKAKPANSYNCWGWGIPTGTSSGIRFSSYVDGVTIVSEGLREKYYDRGLVTIDDIGRRYAASPTWASRVRYFMKQIDEGRAPIAMNMEITL